MEKRKKERGRGGCLGGAGRQSVLLFLMGSILALGLVSVVLFGGQHTVADIRGGRRIGFNSFCDD
jgi:hypothetical protein